MNDEQIEKLLRQGPVMQAPEGLLEKLKGDIRLPRPQMGRVELSPSRPWFKRWLPALSFATIFMVCLVAMAVETNVIADLRRENAELRAAMKDLAALRAENAELQRLRAENRELERLREDNAELSRLKSEVVQLQTETQGLEKLRADNQQLAAATAASQAVAGTNVETDYFAEAKAKAERIQCVNNLKQIGLAARIWAGDHNGIYATDFISMTNELSTWKILQCPTDKSRSVANWADVVAGNVSYIIDAPGIDETQPNVVFAECPIHHNICLVDGSVQQMSDKAMKEQLKMINGLKVMVR